LDLWGGITRVEAGSLWRAFSAKDFPCWESTSLILIASCLPININHQIAK